MHCGSWCASVKSNLLFSSKYSLFAKDLSVQKTFLRFPQILTELSPQDKPIFSFPYDNLSKYKGILTKLSTCIDMNEIWFGIVNGQISSIFDRVIC